MHYSFSSMQPWCHPVAVRFTSGRGAARRGWCGGVAACGWLALALAGATTAGAVEVAAAPPAELPLRRIADVKARDGLAGLGLAVEIEGVVTTAANAGNFFLHDGGMGIHVGQSEAGKVLAPGDRVRVRGVTRVGAYAPAIEPSEITQLGQGRLPVPRRADFGEVASGALDGEWLEMDGVVREVEIGPPGAGATLTLGLDGRQLRVTLSRPTEVEARELIDAEVRLHGVASGTFNRHRQLVEPVVRVPERTFIRVLRPAPADPFALPRVPLSRLLGFSLEAPNPHRVRIEGVVTRHVAPQVLFVRDEGRGLKVETREPMVVPPGTWIEAVGFPALARGAAVLECATVRRLRPGEPAVPVPAGAAALRAGAHHADLVTVRARLVDRVVAGGAATLVLQAEDLLFGALLRPAPPLADLPARESLVEVKGIVVPGESAAPWNPLPPVVGLWLAGLEDLTLVQEPAWWTPGRLGMALAVTLALVGIGFGWVGALRRQVRRKAAVIEQQARHAAVLEERSRIARDLHDTLEQGLTALSLQLKVVDLDHDAAPERVKAGLEAARQMLRRSRALAHDAIRELRTEGAAPRPESLAAGLRRLGELWRMAGMNGVRVRIEGEERSWPPGTERHLLALAAEAVTNAIKHSQATTIDVELRVAAGSLRLEICDNGTGFAPAGGGVEAAGAPGGFGLVGMRERAAAVGGSMTVRSRPGAGTTVVVEVPAEPCPLASDAGKGDATAAAEVGS